MPPTIPPTTASTAAPLVETGGGGGGGVSDPSECTAIILHPSVVAEAAADGEIAADGMPAEFYSSTGGVNASSSGDGQERFVGLSNQGATCYMNSLLQTLYMTPEFRRALYEWTYDEEKDGQRVHCIPLHMQKLFGELQSSKAYAASTTDLTGSFGWEGAEAFQQHDVQELCRVLFDALEDALQGTERQNLIDDLYAGTLIDYIKCREVDYTSQREDKFLDLSLVLRPFGSTKVHHSIAECLEYFLMPEVLEKENKYYCDAIDPPRKVDAVKGLKFKSLPYILTLQLKRFDYDHETFNRIKLNDQVRFPFILDMNRYVDDTDDENHTHANAGVDDELGLQRQLSEEANRLRNATPTNENDGDGDGDGDGDASAATTTVAGAMMDGIDEVDEGMGDDDDDDEVAMDDPTLPDLVDASGIKCPEQLSEENPTYPEDAEIDPEEAIKKHGEWVYELYSVMVHSGSALGGHYYAYIKDLDTGRWYNFNDSSVTEITRQQVREAWGGKQSAYRSSYASSYGANAYMVMYRKIERTRNEKLPSKELVPAYIHKEIELAEAERQKRVARAREVQDQLHVKIRWEGEEVIVKANRNDCLRDFARHVWRDVLKLDPELDNEEEAAAGGADGDGGAGEASIPPPPTDNSTSADGGQSESEGGGGTEAQEQPLRVPFEQFRLREWSVHYKLPLAPIDVETHGDHSLQKVRIHNYKPLAAEIRAADEVWEPWEKVGVNILVHVYDPEKHAFRDREYVRFSRTATVGELRTRLARFVDYDASQLRMIKMVNSGYYSARIEVFNDDSKRLRDANILDATTIYVEEAIGDDDLSPAKKLFHEQLHRLNIEVSALDDNTTYHKLAADRRWLVGKLRQKVAELIGKSVDEFQLFRTSAIGTEIRDDKLTLSQAQIFDKGRIMAVSGTPLRAGQLGLRIVLFKSPFRLGLRTEPLTDAEKQETDPSSIVNNAFDRRASEKMYDIDDDDDNDNAAATTDTTDANANPQGEGEGEGEGEGDATGGQESGEHEEEQQQATEQNQQRTTTPTATPVEAEAAEPAEADAVVSSSAEASTSTSSGWPFPDEDFAELHLQIVPPSDCVQELFTIPVADGITLNALKEQILEEMKKEAIVPKDYTAANIRIRDKAQARPMGIVRDGGNPEQLARDAGLPMFEGKEIGVQIVPGEGECIPAKDDGDAVVVVQRWHRSTWRFGKRFEFLIRGDDTVQQTGQRLADMLGVDVANMALLMIGSWTKVPVSDLPKASPISKSWYSPANETRHVRNMSWYLTDGDMLLVQDKSEELRELTEAERKSVEDLADRKKNSTAYSVNWLSGASSSSRSSGSSSSSSSFRRPEQGIKIKRKAERLAEEAQAKAMAESAAAAKEGAGNGTNGGEGGNSPPPPPTPANEEQQAAANGGTGGDGNGPKKGEGESDVSDPTAGDEALARRLANTASEGQLLDMDGEDRMHTDQEVAKSGGVALFDDLC